MTDVYKKLKSLGACEDALEWAAGKSLEEIWATCHRGDWMLWLFKKTNPNDLKELTRAKCYCALTVRHLMKDERSINACEIGLKFADGLVTREELDAATAAAAAAADAAGYAAATAAAAADAGYAAAAADAGYAAATAAADAGYTAAADAGYAATAAAGYAAATAGYAAAARIKNQKETADICRKYLPIPNL